MAETFCPECGTVFDSEGAVCPNCAAIVGNMRAPPPRSGDGGGLSVMPLAKSSGKKKGILDMDGSSLEINTRQRAQMEGVGHDQPEVQHNSGLATEERENRRQQQQLAPEAPVHDPAVEAEAASGGWLKPVIVVLVIIAVAVGGKLAMDAMKGGKGAAVEEPDEELSTGSEDY